MSEDAWNEMHAEARYNYAPICTAYFNFTQGGVNYFMNCDEATDVDKILNCNR